MDYKLLVVVSKAGYLEVIQTTTVRENQRVTMVNHR